MILATICNLGAAELMKKRFRDERLEAIFKAVERCEPSLKPMPTLPGKSGE